MSKVLEFIDVNKKVGRRIALDNVNFTANRGEIFCLLGRDMTGKTAALELASGIGCPDSGKILLHGTDTKVFPLEIRKNTGLALPSSMMDRNLSVRANLINRAGFFYPSRVEVERKTEEIIDALKLSAVMNAPYGKINATERRKANFARALVGEPSVLILNNATDGLSMADRVVVWGYVIDKIKNRGMSVVMTTNAREDAEYADKVCVMESGRIIYEDYARHAKAAYSSDTLILYADKTAYKTRLLKNESYSFIYYNGAYYVKMRSHVEAIKFVSKYFDDFLSYEIRHTSLAEAYLAIIGEYDRRRGCL